MDKKKILHVVSSLSLRSGGPARAAIDLSYGLTCRGHQVSIYSTYDPDHLGNDRMPASENFEIRLFRLQWPKRYFFAPALGSELRRRIKDFDIVHIHGMWFYPTLIASRVCAESKVPYIIRPCGMLDRYCLSHHKFRKRLYWNVFERRHFERAAGIHFTSTEEFQRSNGSDFGGRAAVVPMGIRTDLFREERGDGMLLAKHPQLQDKRLILFLGRLNFKKGIDLLIKAMRRVISCVPDARLVIAGPDDSSYGTKLKRLCRQQAVADYVSFVGFVEGDEKLALFRASHIFCLPSHQENLGIAVVEAMAAGVPVVVSDQVNIHREIETQGAGIVTACRADEIAKALLFLLSNEGVRRQMASNARRLACAKYDAHESAGIAERLYQRILERRVHAKFEVLKTVILRAKPEESRSGDSSLRSE